MLGGGLCGGVVVSRCEYSIHEGRVGWQRIIGVSEKADVSWDGE